MYDEFNEGRQSEFGAFLRNPAQDGASPEGEDGQPLPRRITDKFQRFAVGLIHSLIRENKTINRENQKLKAQLAQERAYSAQLEKFAHTDSLTGLFNRRYLDQVVGQDNERRKMNGLEILYVDLDGFKKINDTLGHKAGDEGLKSIAALLQSQMREDDIVVRIGGDEFVVLMDGAPSEAAMSKAVQLENALNDHSFEWEGARYRLGGSVGRAAMRGEIKSFEEALREADAGMYARKAERKKAASEKAAPFEIKCG
ncbi:MAG: GGDEF domain-containing protein [Micavibrio sp.]